MPPHLRLLARLVTRRARRLRRPVGVDEVRLADRRSALAHVSGTAPVRPLPRRLRRRHASRRSRSCCSSRALCTSCACSGTAASRGRWGATRRSRSGTGGSTTRADCPTSTSVQRVLEVLLVAGAFVAAFVPRHKSPLQLAALTAALLAGFELVLTYWLYTYIPWFFPFAAIAVLAPAAAVHAHVHADEPATRAAAARSCRRLTCAAPRCSAPGCSSPRGRSSPSRRCSACGCSATLAIYESWGGWLAAHQVPYRDFNVEYPPGALPTFVAPVYLRKLFGYHGTYFFWFRVEILVFALLALAAMTWALARLGASRRRAYAVLGAAGVAPAVLGPIAFFHFDYWPSTARGRRRRCAPVPAGRARLRASSRPAPRPRSIRCCCCRSRSSSCGSAGAGGRSRPGSEPPPPCSPPPSGRSRSSRRTGSRGRSTASRCGRSRSRASAPGSSRSRTRSPACTCTSS